MDHHIKPRRNGAFTLIELLVVISIIALLVAILLPALKHARAAGKSVVCASQLRQFAIAFEIYKDAYKGAIPPPSLPGGVYWYRAMDESGALPQGQRFATNRIWACPAYPFIGAWRVSANHGGHTTYGINFELQDDYDVATKEILQPGKTYLLTDGFNRSGADAWRVVSSKWDYWFTGAGADGFGFFHPNETANTLYFDGHVVLLDQAAVPPWAQRYQPDWNTFWTRRHW